MKLLRKDGFVSKKISKAIEDTAKGDGVDVSIEDLTIELMRKNGMILRANVEVHIPEDLMLKVFNDKLEELA